MLEQNYQNNQTVSAEQNINESEFKPKKKRRWLKIIVWIISSIILLVVLFFSFPYVLSQFWGKDGPPPDDKDLLLSTVNVPKEENGFFDLSKLSKITYADGEIKQAQVNIDVPSGINEMEYKKSYDWEISAVNDLLNKNNEALRIYSEASLKPLFQYDLTADPVNIGVDNPVLDLNTWRQIARISSIKAIYLMRLGNDEAAFNEAMKSIIIGYNIEKSKNLPLIVYLVGISMKQAGLETLQVLISYSASSSVLTNYQNKILGYNSVDNTDPYRYEYMVQKAANALIKHGLTGGIEKLANNNFYFKPNKTIELSGEIFRQLIDRFGKTCADNSSIAIKKQEVSWKIYFIENAAGKLLATLAIPALDVVRDKKCNIDAAINLDNILFAIKKYRLENGSYPANLNDLIPKYANELPPDPYSGNSFIFNAEKKIIYSIGNDRKDDGGGDLQTSFNLMKDPTFSFDFKVTKTSASAEARKLDMNIDSDNDGVSDINELKYGTDPNNPDTDGDGYTDGVEVANGYNPLKK